jgi:hypothetical protein
MPLMRAIAAPFLVAPPGGAHIRTRLRVSAWDEQVLRAVGEHLGALADSDLALRCRLGHGDDRHHPKAGTHCSIVVPLGRRHHQDLQ